ncbi:hypothetical protein [Pseudomonas sp. 24 E 1]|nr:hypothetical protein [Pseudomonas sp. 24 E 1]CRM77706.1 hypothetical protein [Pseudomonas sp. 35 E 8]
MYCGKCSQHSINDLVVKCVSVIDIPHLSLLVFERIFMVQVRAACENLLLLQLRSTVVCSVNGCWAYR